MINSTCRYSSSGIIYVSLSSVNNDTMRVTSGLLAAAATVSLHGCVLCEDGRAQAFAEPRRCVSFRSGQQRLQLQPLGDDSILVTATPIGATRPPPEFPSALITAAADAGAPACTELLAASGPMALTNGNLQASFAAGGSENDDDDGILSFHRVSDGTLLLQESAARRFTPSASARGYYDLELSFKGHGSGVERYFGLGQHQTGCLDNRCV